MPKYPKNYELRNVSTGFAQVFTLNGEHVGEVTLEIEEGPRGGRDERWVAYRQDFTTLDTRSGNPRRYSTRHGAATALVVDSPLFRAKPTKSGMANHRSPFGPFS